MLALSKQEIAAHEVENVEVLSHFFRETCVRRGCEREGNEQNDDGTEIKSGVNLLCVVSIQVCEKKRYWKKKQSGELKSIFDSKYPRLSFQTV